jgi:acetolactate synthase I/II/III large subunit
MDSGDAIARILVAGGVERFYTVPGESFLEILDAVDRHPRLELVSARHEGGAAFMADADAKVTGRPAAVAATRGVGAANLSIGVHTAYQDSTPMIVLLGQVETSLLGREAFQEVDLPAFFRPIAKYAATVHRADRIPELLARAMTIATTGRPGPVVLAFPADVLADRVDPESVARAVASLGRVVRPAASAESVEQVGELLESALCPVLVAGSGARAAAPQLQAVAERYGLGVYAAFRRQDVFDNSHPLFLGHLGLGTAPDCLDALRQADVVLVVGSRLNEITSARYSLPSDKSTVIQVDVEPAMIGLSAPVDVGIVADAGTVLDALARRRSRPVTRDWAASQAQFLASSSIPPSQARVGCDPAQVIAELARQAPADTIIANDAGNFSAFLHRHWRYRSPRSAIGAANGAMGYGVPATVAAKLAAPTRTVVGLTGDGGYLMTGLELETAVRHGLDLTVIVFRNGLHGTIAMHQARHTGRLAGTRIGPVDFAGLAASLGALGLTVRSEDELPAALGQALRHPGPALVEVHCDPDLIAPGLRLSDIRTDIQEAIDQ